MSDLSEREAFEKWYARGTGAAIDHNDRDANTAWDAWQARAALPVQQGWQLVPSEPTDEWVRAIEPVEAYQGVVADSIRVMLSKAPGPKASPLPKDAK